MSSATATPSATDSPEELTWTAEPVLDPTEVSTDNVLRAVAAFDISDHKGFERRLNMAPHVNAASKVFVSITEVGAFGGQVKPFQGAASMEVHNVVPLDNGIVSVRGYIGWERNLNARLSVFVA